MTPTRRTIIAGAGSIGLVGAASACGEGGSGSGESGSGGSADSAPEDAAVAASEVPVGSGVVVDETYVVTQPQEGEFHAFTSVCTHQGCQVRTVTEAEIVCPCHQSMFSTTTGEVLSGPATEPLKSFDVAEADGTLTISAGAGG